MPRSLHLSIMFPMFSCLNTSWKDVPKWLCLLSQKNERSSLQQLKNHPKISKDMLDSISSDIWPCLGAGMSSTTVNGVGSFNVHEHDFKKPDENDAIEIETVEEHMKGFGRRESCNNLLLPSGCLFPSNQLCCRSITRWIGRMSVSTMTSATSR